MKQATVLLQPADILALHTTPFEVLSNPGPGKAYLPFGFFFNMRRGGTNYANGAAIEAYIGEDDNGYWLIDGFPAADVNNGTDIARYETTAGAFAGEDVTQNRYLEDKPIVLTTGTAFISGDGVLKVTVFYETIDL